MYGFRNRVFSKHATLAERLNNPPTEIPAHIWRDMVSKWSDPNWKSTSDKNKTNREKFELTTTGGSVPMAKFRRDKKTGREPDLIETFKKFHVKKGNGEFTTPKAQTIHAKLKNKEAEKLSQGEEVNQFAIYGEIVGNQPRKHVLGMGAGVSGVDVFALPPVRATTKDCRGHIEEAWTYFARVLKCWRQVSDEDEAGNNELNDEDEDGTDDETSSP
ncbi:unnamed protein product [Linum trigynum]|uniref:Uncharacterized protein n=1 Tax=Linum trigynum TaxID=586398 RepID=A0AAV2DCE7_9ROSI